MTGLSTKNRQISTREEWADAVEPALLGCGLAAPLPSVSVVARQYWLTICVLAGLVLAISVPAVWAFIKPQYQASAVIRVSQVLPKLGERDELTPAFQSFFKSQLGIINGPTVLQAALDRDDVQATTWYNRPPPPSLGDPPSRLEQLRDILEVRDRPLSELIDVRITATSGADAMVIANAVTEEYIELTNQRNSEDSDKEYEVLTFEQRSLTNSINSRNDQLMRMRKEVAAPEVRLGLQHARYDELKDELARTRRGISDLEGRLAVLLPDGAAPSAERPAPKVDFTRDVEWLKRDHEVKAAEHILSLEEARLGVLHPELVKPRRDVELFRRLREDREEQLIANPGGAVPAILAGAEPETDDPRKLQARLDGLRATEQQLVAAIADKLQEIQHISKYWEDITDVSSELRKEQQRFSEVSDNLHKRELMRRVPGAIRIVDPATAPSRPDRDRRILLTATSLLVAAAIGLGGGYLRFMADTTVREDSALARMAREPFLGHLPRVANPQQPGDLADVQAECVRMVRTALLERLEGDRGSAVLITSAGSQAGKTTLSTLLARSLAEAGLRVLLVDADRRRGTIANTFSMPAAPGLCSVLAGTVEEREAIRPGPIAGLSILPAGQYMAHDNAELFAQRAYAACLERWRGTYDIILLDAPPLLPVADARILARHVDGTILVVRAAYCRRADVLEALSALSIAGGRLIGTVMTGARRPEAYLSAYGSRYQPVIA